MANNPLLPCPGCGFLIHPEGQYGSYGICPFCDWEDCPFQLANPHDNGGPNGMSLVKHQEIALRQYPLTVQAAEARGRTFERDPAWRPLTTDEIAFYDGAPDWFPPIYDVNDCYWIRSPLG